jgi:hypothetical protein
MGATEVGRVVGERDGMDRITGRAGEPSRSFVEAITILGFGALSKSIVGAQIDGSIGMVIVGRPSAAEAIASGKPMAERNSGLLIVIKPDRHDSVPQAPVGRISLERAVIVRSTIAGGLMGRNSRIETATACYRDIRDGKNIQIETTAVDEVKFVIGKHAGFQNPRHDIFVMFPLKRSHIGLVQNELAVDLGEEGAHGG